MFFGAEKVVVLILFRGLLKRRMPILIICMPLFIPRFRHLDTAGTAAVSRGFLHPWEEFSPHTEAGKAVRLTLTGSL